MTSLDFPKRKQSNQKISMVTCYDATFARLVNDSNVDCILVGDSCSMVMHGNSTTLPANLEMMASHTKAVRSSCNDNAFIVADMPFLSTRQGKYHAVSCAGTLLKSGANAVKIEGVLGQEDIIRYIVESGIPVIGHIGLTPQFYNTLGGHKRQGKTEESAQKIKKEAFLAEKAGCIAIVLECIPPYLAEEITESISIPTIGIGSGPACDGQVLVLQDLLGMSSFMPKFVHSFLNGKEVITDALNQYASEVSNSNFPYRENY